MNNSLSLHIRLLKKRIKKNSFWWTICFYYHRLCQLMFSYIMFNRTDMYIFPDARLGGIEFMQIGKSFSAGRGLWLEAVSEYPASGQNFSPKLIIGNKVGLGEYVHIGCNNHIEIGNNVLMGSKIYITDHNHGIYRGDNPDTPVIPPLERRLTEGASVIIGNQCWIGEFVTILPGVTIGEGTIIGSHSTVTHDIPANSIAVGSPARVVKQWNETEQQWLRV